jgi:hypothetical protein
MHAFKTAMLTSALVIAAAPLAAEESADAHALYGANCTSCHGTEVYTREDRRVQSLDQLKAQVRMCEQNLGLKWFDDEVNAVATLLNEEYYGFEQ